MSQRCLLMMLNLLLSQPLCAQTLQSAEPASQPTDITLDMAKLPELDQASQISRTELSRATSQSISKGVKYLLSRQNENGSWTGPSPDSTTGATALVTLALLYAGESYQSPPLERAITYLKRARPERLVHATYTIGLRAAVYASLPEALRKNELRADLRWLQVAVIDRGDRRGMYDYNTAGRLGGDYSNSQYGVLGVWYAAQAGLEVPRAYWQQIEAGWLAGQNLDGGWSYQPGNTASYSSMTAAGAATLYITNDYLHSADARDLSKTVENKALTASLAWLGENFAVQFNAGRQAYNDLRGFRRNRGGGGIGARPGDQEVRDLMGNIVESEDWIHYMLFGYERVGEASGYTRFGTHKWYDEGAAYLIATQDYDGSWDGDPSVGTACNTAYALLFLSRGRAPVVAQKLEFDGRWNNRPRDLSAFTQFMRRATERHVNWQIASIDATPAELREAPLLYLASDVAFAPTDDQLARLKGYIDQGGLLICVNEGTGSAFARSIEALGQKLYPAYRFRDLPPNHLAYTANFAANRTTGMIRGLSNGVRDLIVLYPAGDFSWQWHSAGGAFDPRNTPYASLANLWLYATDRANPRFKGEDSWVERNPGVTATRTATIARLRHESNWNPEPGGWERLANLMHNFDQVDLTLQPVAGNPQTATLAHLTATGTVRLDPAMLDGLRKYTQAGGLLLIDAAGGSPEAAASFEPLLRQLYADVLIAPLPLDHPIYRSEITGGNQIKEVKYRRSPNLQPVRTPRLRGATSGGKLIAIVSNEDLSGALVGYNTAGLTGYTTPSATDIVRNIILWRLSLVK
jgi:hypothetical protein